MKSIKITQANKVAITAALRSANGTAAAHTVTDYSIVEMIAAKYEEKLLALVGTKARAAGAMVTYVSGDALPKAYDYGRIVSHLTLERRSSAWFLTNATTRTAHTEFGAERLILSKTQDEAAVSIFRRKYQVAPSQAVGLE